MSHSHMSDDELAATLAELCRAFAEQKSALLKTELEMREISMEIDRRLNTSRPSGNDHSDPD